MRDSEKQLGYILIARKLFDSEIIRKPPNYFKVWIYLLLNATHKKRGGLNRGEGFTSISKLIDFCTHYVGARPQRPTRKEIYGIIEWLRNPHEGNSEGETKVPMIVTTKVTRGFVYKIVKYDAYQNSSSYEGNTEGNNESPTKVQRRGKQGNTINKNVKNDKNDKNVFKTIVDFLNEKVGTNFKYNTLKTKNLIQARLNEKFTVEDFKTVIINKSNQWLGNSDMKRYLRPETLFGTKFESYLNEKDVEKKDIKFEFKNNIAQHNFDQRDYAETDFDEFLSNKKF